MRGFFYQPGLETLLFNVCLLKQVQKNLPFALYLHQLRFNQPIENG
jgi:hypothetical protein